MHPWTGRALHFVGIGGAGMSGLAVVAHALGATVTGSDRAAGSPYAGALRAAGIEPVAGHDADNVPADAELVVSSAIPPENPERAIGRERGQRELHRAALLGELTRLRPDDRGDRHPRQDDHVEHGRARAARLRHGSRLPRRRRRALDGRQRRLGRGEWLVVEADESDRSLLELAPGIAVLTNAELDHHTTYASLRDVDDTFRAFLASPTARPWSGTGRSCSRSPRAALPLVPFDAAPELTAGGSRFTLDGVEVELAVPGAHNAATRPPR